MKIYKVRTFSIDSNGNKSDVSETLFSERSNAEAYASRNERIYTDECGGFWSEEKENTFAEFDATGQTGTKLTMYAIVTELALQ